MPTTRKAATTRATPEAISMLMQDHRKVKKMFKDVEKMRDGGDGRRDEIIARVCKELTVHTRLEEEVFYPFAREKLPDGRLLDEAKVEHASAKELIAQIEGDDGEMRDARFQVLGEYVNHHIREEEKELFPKLLKQKEAKEDLQSLAQEMQERKSVLASEAGLPAEEEEEEQRPRARRRSGASSARTTSRGSGAQHAPSRASSPGRKRSR